MGVGASERRISLALAISSVVAGLIGVVKASAGGSRMLAVVAWVGTTIGLGVGFLSFYAFGLTFMPNC